ncbi:hypothetical protein GGR77_003694 [Xanthomonas translucens]
MPLSSAALHWPQRKRACQRYGCHCASTQPGASQRWQRTATRSA